MTTKPMTMAEKILARTSSAAEVSAGEFVTAKADRMMLNDMVIIMVKTFKELGLKQFKDPDKAVVVFDHFFLPATAQHSDMLKMAEAFLKPMGLKHNLGAVGVSHQVMCEQGFVTSGDLVMGTDSHSTMYGAMGAAGAGIGATEMVYLLVTGELWYQVPETIGIELKDKPSPGVTAKDIVLRVIGKLGGDYARIFFRNAVARALPVLICPEITKGVNEGDVLSVDWDSFRIDNLTQGTSFQATPYNQDMKNIIESGGLVSILKKQLNPDSINTTQI